MELPIGFRVKNIHTGEVGRVSAWIDEQMVMLDLHGDLIPAFVEDLLPATEADERDQKSVNFSKKLSKNAAPPAAPSLPQLVKIMGGFVENRGIYLAFLPENLPSGLVEHYKIWLVNDSADDALFVFSLKTSAGTSPESDEKTVSRTARFLTKIAWDALNDSPEIKLSLRRISTAGAESAVEKTLKIRANSFFKNVREVHFLENEGPVLSIISKNEDWGNAPESAESKGGLADYSKTIAKKPATTAAQHSSARWLDLEEKASFEPEIDLHIEKLTADPSRLTPSEIVQLQLRQADIFMDNAYRLGLDQVFLIHGLGAGRLRDLLHARLRNNPGVAWFKNEYHKKYGYGATEVIFK